MLGSPGDSRFRQWEKGRRDRFNAKLEELSKCCEDGFAGAAAEAAEAAEAVAPGAQGKCPSKVTDYRVTLVVEYLGWELG